MHLLLFPGIQITSIKSEIKYSPKMILVKLQLVLRISDIKITKMVSEWGEARPSEHVYSTVGDFTYRIYLIKCPGVYFLAASVEGAFKRDGAYLKRAFIVLSTLNSCSSAVIMLFLAAATALSFNLKS